MCDRVPSVAGQTQETGSVEMTRLRGGSLLRPANVVGELRKSCARWGRRRPKIWCVLALLARASWAGTSSEPVGQDPAGDCEIAATDATVASPAVTPRSEGRGTGQRLAKQMGPLVVLAANPRYFADPLGRAVFLAGSHTWNDLIDMDSTYPPRPLDFDEYLNFLQQNHHNFTRLWAWETTRPDDGDRYPGRVVAAPQAWPRTGPGLDVTGLPKFDLSKLDPRYFERLRTRVEAARRRGIYVAVMLFEGWSVQFSKGSQSHPFLAPNNINGLDDVTDPGDIHTLRFPRVTSLQKAYVRAVVNALADMDNVLYEIANEAGPASTEWQYEMIRFVKCLEAGRAVRHPVGMSYQYKGGRNDVLFQSAAEWVAPSWESGHYMTAPELATGNKVIIADTDHLGGSGFSDVPWVWRSLFRGVNVVYMDKYVGEDSVDGDESAIAAQVRGAIGSARVVADFVGIGRFVPSRDHASTGFALIADDAILVLAPSGEVFTLDLRDRAADFETEWLDFSNGTVVRGASLKGGATAALKAPFHGGGILYVRKASAPPLASVEHQLIRVHDTALHHASTGSKLRWVIRAQVQRIARRTRTALGVLATAFAGGVGVGLGLAWLFVRMRRQRKPLFADPAGTAPAAKRL